MDPGTGNEHHRALLMATSAQFQWPSPRGFVSAYAQNLMSADSCDSSTSKRVRALSDNSDQQYVTEQFDN